MENQNEITEHVKRKYNLTIKKLTPLATSFGITGAKLWLDDGRTLALKANFNKSSTEFIAEADMLEKLRQAGWLVPTVHGVDENTLLMSWLENDGTRLSPEAEFETGAFIAKRHQTPAPFYGFEQQTFIARLPQPNHPDASWLDFYITQRLLPMAQSAYDEGKLPKTLLTRLKKLSENLTSWIKEPDHPCLIHGDLWGGNIMVAKGRLTGFIDPAIYYADAEIELAFTQMFNTFGKSFFKGYQSVTTIKDGFWEERLPLYNLYPTLVHVRLFGASYLPPIDRCLTQFGY